MKIIAIKTSDGYFIKDETKINYTDLLSTVTFNREKPTTTWKQGWWKITDCFGKVEKYEPATNKIVGYNLLPDFVATEALPLNVSADYFGDGDYSRINMYSPILEDVPEVYEDIDVEIKVVAELYGKLVQETIGYPVYGSYPKSEGKSWTVRNSELKLGLIDEITTPEILKEERPCELSSAHSFAIIRAYIKDNIDPKVATISSDYEFCLSVEKRIPLAEKETYTVDENFNFFSKRKRVPKMVTKYRVERKKIIYEIAPRKDGKVYGSYPEAPIFRGENARNLKANIDEYLKSLIKEINRPLHDCPHCKGIGVVED
jgi:hypothetical protein